MYRILFIAALLLTLGLSAGSYQLFEPAIACIFISYDGLSCFYYAEAVVTNVEAVVTNAQAVVTNA